MGAPGFDDAPLVTVPCAPACKNVTFVYPYYENPKFLQLQLQLWHNYPQEIRAHLAAIVVDDGSPFSPAAAALLDQPQPFPIRLFRIDVDVRWNWLAARNIGMDAAAPGWCLLTDMDHMIPLATARRLVEGWHDIDVIYRLQRTEGAGPLIHPHPNSMFMTRTMFWRCGGYDEALSGHYGTDGDWRRRCAKTAKVLTLTESLSRYEHNGDSSTTRYLRKQPQDAGKKAIIRKRGANWKPRVLSFPYHEIRL